jgi:hypothetical protein
MPKPIAARRTTPARVGTHVDPRDCSATRHIEAEFPRPPPGVARCESSAPDGTSGRSGGDPRVGTSPCAGRHVHPLSRRTNLPHCDNAWRQSRDQRWHSGEAAFQDPSALTVTDSIHRALCLDDSRDALLVDERPGWNRTQARYQPASRRDSRNYPAPRAVVAPSRRTSSSSPPPWRPSVRASGPVCGAGPKRRRELPRGAGRRRRCRARCGSSSAASWTTAGASRISPTRSA